MCMRCPPTVGRLYRHHCRCGAGCEQVVHENAHAKKINKVLKTLDVVCNIIRSGSGIIMHSILCWSVERGGVAERLENGYRTIWWYCVTTVVPALVAYDYTVNITSTIRPDDRTTGSSEITYKPTPRFRRR